MIAKYIRVSTLEQNTDRQVTEHFDGKVYLDKISGSTSLNERPQGSKLMQDIQSGLITELHIHSIDRLGRNTIDILTTIELIIKLGCNVIAEKEALTMIINGKVNPIAKMMLGILSTLAEFELSRIKERQAEGIASAKSKGIYKTNTRPIGSTETTDNFLNKQKSKEIQRYLKQNFSIRKCALLSKSSVGTVQKVKKITNDI